MGTSDSRMAKDLTAHALEDLQRVLNRHMSVAMPVLPPAEVAVMLLNIANGMAMGAALYTLQMSKEDAPIDDLWESLRSHNDRSFTAARPELMRRFADLGRAEAA